MFTAVADADSRGACPLLGRTAFGGKAPSVLVIVVRDFTDSVVPSVNSCGSITMYLSSVTRRDVLFAEFCTGDFHASENVISVLDNCPTRPAADVVHCPHGADRLPSVTHGLTGCGGCGAACCCNKSTSFYGVHSCLISRNCRRVVSSTGFPVRSGLDG